MTVHAMKETAAPRRNAHPTRGLAWLAGLALLLAPLALSACGDDNGPTGTLQVAVYQEDRSGSPNKQIEIRDTGQSARTNDAGVATFTLPAGRHVVRAYELGAPGPATQYQEQTIGVIAGQSVNVEFFDCRLCQ